MKKLLLREIYFSSGKDSALIHSTHYTSSYNYGLTLNKFDKKTKAILNTYEKSQKILLTWHGTIQLGFSLDLKSSLGF